ncbi:unnamed protein product, partial [Cyprideis torosa]
CLDDCLKNQFISGGKYNTSGACQISGFQNVDSLEPCKTLENAKDALSKYVRSSVRIGKDFPIPQSLKTCENKCPRSCNQFWYTFKQTGKSECWTQINVAKAINMLSMDKSTSDGVPPEVFLRSGPSLAYHLSLMFRA